MPVAKKKAPAKKRVAKKLVSPIAEEATPYSPSRTIRKVRIDKHTIISNVVDIHRTTCPTCGYDVLRSNKNKLPYEDYEMMPEEARAISDRVLEKHRETHSAAEVAAATAHSKELDGIEQ